MNMVILYNKNYFYIAILFYAKYTILFECELHRYNNVLFYFSIYHPKVGDSGVEASGGAIGFEQHQNPGPSSGGYIPQTGPYIPSPTGSNHNLPTPNSHIPGGPPIGAHAPPTTPQEPNHGAKALPSQPLPAATAWKPPKPTGLLSILWNNS